MVLLIALVAGCATTMVRDDVLSGGTVETRLAALGLTTADLAEPAAASAEMVDWIRQRVPDKGSQSERVNALLTAVVEKRGLDLQYDAVYTGTAQEVFASREANCLAFTHLVVGLGRELGLPVYYLGFRQRPRYEREGTLVVVWEHVTAGFGGPGERMILQLAVGPRFDYEDARPISDQMALAMHYSNRGAELLRLEEPERAREMLKIATAVDPTWSHAWVNLGVAFRRSGELEAAEAAYRRALIVAPDHVQAYHNLAMLLWLRDRRDAASEILRLLDRRDNRDPFVYLSLGDMSRREQRPDEARRFYRRAARLAPKSAEPLAALGLLAVLDEKRPRAERLLRRAEKRAPDEERVIRLRKALELSSGVESSVSG